MFQLFLSAIEAAKPFTSRRAAMLQQSSSIACHWRLAHPRFQLFRSRRFGSLRTRLAVAADGRMSMRSRSPQSAKSAPEWGVARNATFSMRSIRFAARVLSHAMLSAARSSCLMMSPPRLCPMKINGPRASAGCGLQGPVMALFGHTGISAIRCYASIEDRHRRRPRASALA